MHQIQSRKKTTNHAPIVNVSRTIISLTKGQNLVLFRSKITHLVAEVLVSVDPHVPLTLLISSPVVADKGRQNGFHRKKLNDVWSDWPLLSLPDRQGRNPLQTHKIVVHIVSLILLRPQLIAATEIHFCYDCQRINFEMALNHVCRLYLSTHMLTKYMSLREE